ncbi:MAG TPA: amidase [Anaerolineales bacterium]|nr:amidase [Anaerolineales bacterium]
MADLFKKAGNMQEYDLLSLDIEVISGLFRSGSLSPVELTQFYLERIGTIDKKTNSFITVTPDLAMQQAKRAEKAFAQARKEGQKEFHPLLGIPISLKDLYQTIGIPTTAGAKIFRNHIPTEDAHIVEKLFSAGAVLLGKTNLHEIALGLTTVNPHYGVCRNPWALDRISGGSSGGSAAALAAGLCMISMGSDTGGSIRVPAGLCGVVGLKPTYGRVSLRGVMPLSWNLDHAGPMGRRVQDVAYLFQSVAAYDPEDASSVNLPVDDVLGSIKQGVKGWRIALADDEYFSKSDPEVLGLIAEAANVFEMLGAQVERKPFPEMYAAALNNGLMVVSDAATVYAEQFSHHPETFGEDIRQRLEIGSQVKLQEYIHARRQQVLLRRRFESFFDGHDLLLMPTTAVPAPPVEGPDALEQARLLTRYTAPFNLTGLPALSIPCGFSKNGLPVGLQLIARPWHEASLLRAAYAYEDTTRWYLQRPEI